MYDRSPRAPRMRTPDLTGATGGFGWPMGNHPARTTVVTHQATGGKTVGALLPPVAPRLRRPSLRPSRARPGDGTGRPAAVAGVTRDAPGLSAFAGVEAGPAFMEVARTTRLPERRGPGGPRGQ